MLSPEQNKMYYNLFLLMNQTYLIEKKVSNISEME